jgi:dipeptidyl aminopeptidase/acylaminoacyl peptidase
VTRRIPLEDFFRKPERAGVDLSPSGRYLSWLAPWERRMNLFVRDLETGEERRLTSVKERDLAGTLWADDEHLVYARDTGGDENFRLYAVHRGGGPERDLTPYDEVKCSIVDDLEDVPDELLFQMNERDARVFDVYRLKVSTGEIRMVAENPGNVQGWVTDNAGALRLATTTDGVNTSLLYRATEEGEWRTIATYDFKESASPVGFTFDDARLVVHSNVGRDKHALRELDPETGEEGPVLFEHPEVDVTGLLRSRARRVVTGCWYETDKVRFEFTDPERAGLQEFLDTELPGRENRLAAHDRAERRWIVHSGGDRTLGSYHLLETPEGGEPRLEPLFDLAPWLVEDELCEMQPISYEARDGLTIHGYLTLPRERGDGPLPLVVNPHGGPWHRDSWGFRPEVQFLANRGVAVLQMNFRGSTGYGRAFWEASFGQWGLAMQDDVTDGVRWAIDEGIADPGRVAIYGGSYGGYSTLSGVTTTPELYACAVSYVGVSNLFTWIEAFPPYWEPFLEMVYEMVGHPERDEERYRATSPFFHADRIRCPLFVAQGANDPRVRKEESDQIVAALGERGVETEYLVKDDEGHGFSNEENRFEFYRAMEAFLTEHLSLQRR